MNRSRFLFVMALGVLSGCSPVQRCYQNADCEAPKVCMPDGECDYKCREDGDCGSGFSCVMYDCVAQMMGELKCPEGMVAIQNTFCMDQYEASRPDATARSAGTDSTMAVSKRGVMPWQVGGDNAAAEAACVAAGKRLCTPAEWEFSCHGAENTKYGYGNTYDPVVCNGLETYGRDKFHLMPTGSFQDCENGWNVYDLNGNLWEHTAGGSAKTARGGAFNCVDSELNHQCSYIPNQWSPLSIGFRCCSDGELELNDEQSGTGGTGEDQAGDKDVDSGDGGADSGNGGTDSGDGGADSGDGGADSGDVGADSGDGGDVGAIAYACPSDMALVTWDAFAFCMDRYEASRSDATSAYEGTSVMPVSKAGVMPWYRPTFEDAAAACQSVGKHLCNADEWQASCSGADQRKYSYGQSYDPTICNGIDTYCACESASCAENTACPFAHCYTSCGANLRLMPTGSFERCQNVEGIYDLSGNLWEYVDDGSGQPSVRGGAYNCIDSEKLHQCSTVLPVSSVNAYGFRCCKAPDVVETTAGEPQAWVLPQNDEVPSALEETEDQGLWGENEILLAWEHADTMQDFGFDFVTQKKSSTPELIELARKAAQKTQPILLADQSNGVISADQWYEDYACIAPEHAIESVQELWMFKETREDALEIIKFAKKCNPQSDDVERALGISYARMENYVWAMKSFSKLIAKNPNDCETVAWIAWTYQQMAMPDEVASILSQTTCDDDLLAHRLTLIHAMNDLTQNRQSEANQKLEAVYGAEALYRSDREALHSMQTMVGNVQSPNLSWKLEVDFGYASNALSSAPSDPSLADKDAGSPLLEGDLRITLDPWKRAFARAVLEAQVTGQWLMADDAKDSSYGNVVLRPGVVLDAENFKFGAYYRPEFLFLHGGDMYDEGPLLFYTSHRIEVDFEIQKWLYIFAGYGHRTFRQRVRTRDELDIGAGGVHGLGAGFSLTWGVTYRHWFSVGDMYDLNGTHVSLALDYRIRDVQFRLSSAYSFDNYADSAGYFAQEARQDHALRGTFQVWSPALAGVRVGAEFKASRRWSSADNYDYEDYRGMIAVRWTGDLDFYAPRAVSDDFYALPWNLESTSSTERIRDMIQQDEDMQRSSSCLQN